MNSIDHDMSSKCLIVSRSSLQYEKQTHTPLIRKLVVQLVFNIITAKRFMFLVSFVRAEKINNILPQTKS